MLALIIASTVLALSVSASAIPTKRWAYQKYFDLQGHRGGRGEAVESTLVAFGSGIIDGVTTLEMDNGLTKDGVVVVWHDESIDPTKCLDTAPVVANDSMYPYVGKYIANLTLAQVKTLDCGSQRLAGFPNQISLPGSKISTMQEVFEFVKCATDEPVLFNIESKTDGDFHNLTRSPEDFVKAQLEVFKAQGPDVVDRITYQSFDWRTIILSKKQMPELRTSALCDDTTIYRNPVNGNAISNTVTGNLTVHGKGPSNWLAGIDIDSFNGSTVGERVARAAHSIKADFISPVGTSYASSATGLDPKLPGWIPFANKTMVDTAHSLGMQVKIWTPNRLNLFKYLLDIGVDGIITDFPDAGRKYIIQRGLPVAPLGDAARVGKCLAKYNQLAPHNITI